MMRTTCASQEEHRLGSQEKNEEAQLSHPSKLLRICATGVLRTRRRGCHIIHTEWWRIFWHLRTIRVNKKPYCCQKGMSQPLGGSVGGRCYTGTFWFKLAAGRR